MRAKAGDARRRSVASILLALGLLVATTGTTSAGRDAVVIPDEPLPTDAAPGSTITVGWSIAIPDGLGALLPMSAQGIYVRFTPATGKPLDVTGTMDHEGHYEALVTVPKGGLGTATYGLKGKACVTGGTCQETNTFFRLATAADLAGPSLRPTPVVEAPAVEATPTPVVAAPAPSLVDQWLPLVALLAIVGVVVAVVVRGRQPEGGPTRRT